MKPLTRLEDEPPFGAIFLQLIKSAFLTRTSRSQTRITGVKNKPLAHRLTVYGSIGIEIDFLDPIAGRTTSIARRYTSGL